MVFVVLVPPKPNTDGFAAVDVPKMPPPVVVAPPVAPKSPVPPVLVVPPSPPKMLPPVVAGAVAWPNVEFVVCAAPKPPNELVAVAGEPVFAASPQNDGSATLEAAPNKPVPVAALCCATC